MRQSALLPQQRVPSMNTVVEYEAKASSLRGLTSTGVVQVGDRAFEYYNDTNARDYIQIPWGEFDYVSAEVLPGRHIPRFAIFTRTSGRFVFSTRDNKATLRAVREHVPAERLLKSMNFFQVIGRGFLFLPHVIRERIARRGRGKEPGDVRELTGGESEEDGGQRG